MSGPADWQERQNRIKPTDLNDDLAKLVQSVNDLAKYLGKDPAAAQPVAGVAHHHDYHHDAVISADHGLAGDLALPATLAAVFLVQQLTDTLKSVMDAKDALLDERDTSALSAKIAETWDQFKADTGQVIDDVKQQMTELLSPERTQDQAPAQQQATSAEIGGPQVDKDTAEIRKLEDKQEKERADQAERVAERRDQLAEKYEGSPEQEQYLKQFDDAARQAEAALARQQAAELQRLQEQQLQQQLQGPDR
jgi:hypothetical protein